MIKNDEDSDKTLDDKVSDDYEEQDNGEDKKDIDKYQKLKREPRRWWFGVGLIS